MKHLIDSVKLSMDTENWYSALTLCLTLPDIAGKKEYPAEQSSKIRFANWFEKYLTDYRYFHPVANEEIIFMSGNDCYALRCAFLHEGTFDISMQRAQEIITNFEIIAPGESKCVMHKNKMNDKLQLDVKIFCGKIIDAISRWLSDISNDQTKNEKLNLLMQMEQLK